MEMELSEEQIVNYYKSVENMIWSIIHRFRGISYQDKEDIFQEASFFVVTHLVKKYSPDKNVKFQNFAYICLENFIIRKVNNLNKKNKLIISDSSLLEELNEAVSDLPYEFNSERLELIKIMAYEDSNLLKPTEKEVIRRIFENPTITQREISEAMNYAFVSSVGSILSKLRKKIKETDLLERAQHER